jgi:hypothetical protein
MRGNPFENFRDWGAVLEELEQRTEAGGLDEIQPVLVRLIRYRDNWRLREEGMRAAAKVTQPCPELVRALLAVAADAELYVDARILAARGLAALVPLHSSLGLSDDVDPDQVLAVLREQLTRFEPPVLRLALEHAIDQIAGRTTRVPA